MYAKDTIAAVSTPPGIGAIGIIRLSGPQALAIAGQIFVATQRPDPTPYRLRHGHLIDAAGEAIDEVLAVAMIAPHSYTGEDAIEIHCHGNPIVLRRALARCLECGARPAEPGELTKRAFLNGRLDLVQSEAVAELISARTEAAARTSLRHLSGALSAELAGIRDKLVEVKARAEVMIDFSEEEIDLAPADLLDGIDAARGRVAALLSSFGVGRLLREGLHVTLLGRPNVGKSSLLNALLQRDRAIVTAVPGTTRDVIAESLDIGGIPVVLSDTAGVRADPDEIESLGIELTRREAASADVVLVVLDRSAGLTDDDRAVLASVLHTPSLVAANKADLVAAWGPGEVESVTGARPIEVSALLGTGLAELRERIVALAAGPAVDPGAPIVTLVRHREALGRTAEALERSRASILAGAPIDATAVDIQAAVEHIGSITGEVTSEEVLDRIFSEFCIGK